MRFRSFVISITFLFLLGCQVDPLKDALKEVNTDNFLAHITTLSDDAMEGRGPGTPGDVKAAEYIVSQYKAIGLEPLGEGGTYLQKVPMIGFRIDPGVTLDFKKSGKSLRLKFSDDFVAFTGFHEPTVSLKNAEVVFVGYGIVAPEQNWDDYKDVNVAGKVLLMLNNDPATDDPTFFAGKGRTYYGRWTYKYEIAAQKGAVGAIVLHTTESAGYPYHVVQSSWARENFDLEGDNTSARLKLKTWTTEDATRKFVSMAGFDLDKLIAEAQHKTFKPQPLGIALTTTMKFTIRRLETNNIVGILQGSDAELSKEYLIFTAHHDHLGIGKPVDGDSIYNGALDNASGISMMLSMAKGFKAMAKKPKRSMIFAAVAAEEYGLLGSRFYAENPTVPIKSIIANINTDGSNIWGKTTDITLLGSERSTLGDDIAVIAKEMQMEVTPDSQPEQGLFFRSDHFNFAKVGVPCLFLKSGTKYIGKPENFAKEQIDAYIAKHYHQPSDEISDMWNLEGAIQQTEFLMRLAVRIANNPNAPSWNPNDEFAKYR